VRKELFIREARDVGGGVRGRKEREGYQGPMSSRGRGEYKLLRFSLYATNISFCYLGLDP
jgi:hypothetical protein